MAHIVSAYDEELAALDNELARMGGLAEQQLAQAIDAMSRADHELAEEVIRADKEMDRLEREVEERAVLLIARRQPMARDLREVVVAIKTSSDLERIGDLAKNIAKRVKVLSGDRPIKIIGGLGRMARLVLEQLKNVLDAHARRDADKALEVWLSDEQIDAMYNSLFRELLTYMMEDPRNIGICTHLLFAAKNMERMGDHATNIAENVYFLVHGVSLADERPKLDVTTAIPLDPGKDDR